MTSGIAVLLEPVPVISDTYRGFNACMSPPPLWMRTNMICMTDVELIRLLDISFVLVDSAAMRSILPLLITPLKDTNTNASPTIKPIPKPSENMLLSVAEKNNLLPPNSLVRPHVGAPVLAGFLGTPFGVRDQLALAAVALARKCHLAQSA